MSSSSSRLRYRLVLMDYTEERSGSKQKVKTWFDEASFWGQIDFAYKGEETIGGHRESEVPQLASVSQVWIYTRHRNDIRFEARKRIRYGSRIFQIVAVYDTPRMRRFRILAQEVQT